jgi:hypothetical protein
MQRRPFLKWLFSVLAALRLPRWARAGTVAAADEKALEELGSVVLPESLGRARTDKIAADFATWIRGYKAGAETNTGYGVTRIQPLPADPSAHYAEQLAALDKAAETKGAPFARLDAAAKRALVGAAIDEAKVERIPPRPNGRHVAADMLAFFYNSSDGQDYLYGVAIKRDDCRGLANSGERPKPVG